MDPLSWQVAWMFARKFWKELLLAAILIAGCLWWNAHVRADNRMELRAIHAEAQAKVDRAEKEALQASLANAKAAADKAKAETAAAEKAAQKRLQAREKYWQEKYRNDPKARAWASEPIPAGVLDGLRH